MMQTRSCSARVKLAGEDDTENEDQTTESASSGQFEALVSVFGNKDSYGEVVMPGAFTRTLDEWAAKGDPIPVYWSHRLDDPDFNIGHVIEAKETDEGLWVKGQLDLDNPKAMSTYNLMKSRRVTDFSFSFNVPPGGASEGDDAIELNDLDLYEVGPTPIGANPETELIGVKAGEEFVKAYKAGRVLSAKNVEKIKAARDAMRAAESALSELLKINDSGDDEEKSKSVVKIEEPRPVKIEEPTAVDYFLVEIETTMMEGMR
jgi:HK97 family phage prohead protease